MYAILTDEVKANFAANREYWKQFERSVTQKASNSVYETFLKSNGQELGLKSSGACVNLLTHYYYEIELGA